MAEADIDVVIRRLAKQQHKDLMAAVKGRRDHHLALAAKAKDRPARDKYKQIAKDTVEQGTAAARRLQISADNAADSFARSMRHAAEASAAEAARQKTAVAKKAVKAKPKPVKKAKA
jgi:hypothetical protein